MYGLSHLLDNLSATWERAGISNDMIQFMIIENLAICIFGSMCGSQMVMENRCQDLIILWIDQDNLVGRPKV